MSKISYKLPIYIETGVRKKRKNYLNLNIMRNMPFHLSNNLKREMKRIVKGACPEFHFTNYTLTYKLYLPNLMKRDVSNVCSIVDKFQCDALVELGYVPEDNYEHLKKIVYEFGGYDDKKKGYVEVIVEEVNDV